MRTIIADGIAYDVTWDGSLDSQEESQADQPRAKQRRGFACLAPEQIKAMARKGGRAAHEKGTAHVWTDDEARAAGTKGGAASAVSRKARRHD